MKQIPAYDGSGKVFLFNEDEYIERKSVYGICRENNQILLVQDKWFKGWSLPGGGLDNDETYEEALKREFIEETGMVIESVSKLLLSDINYFKPEEGDKPWKTLRSVYLVTTHGGLLKTEGNGDDVLQAKYIDINSAIKLLIHSKSNESFGILLKTL